MFNNHILVHLISCSRLISIVSILLLFSFGMKGEGTKQMSPTEDDWVILQLREGFANYGTSGTVQGLNFAILDTTEEVYFAFSRLGFSNFRSISNVSYEFRVVDSLGNVVHGPHTITPLNVNGSDYNQVVAGPNLGAGGYDVSNPIYNFSPSSPGIYHVEFNIPNNTGGFLNEGIVWWDISVMDAMQTPKLGRVYSKNWWFRSPTNGNPDIFAQPFEGKVYVLTDDGFVHLVDFENSGFRGLTFALAFNSTGPGSTGNLEEDRKTISGLPSRDPEYDIYLNDPDPVLYDAASFGEVILGPFLTSNAQCDTTSSSFCIDYTVTEIGLIEIILDLHLQDGKFTPGTEDRILLDRIDVGEPLNGCVPWDLIDGLGNKVDPFLGFAIFIRYSQGEVHFMMNDVEYNNPGFISTLVHPNGGIAENFIFYDDTNLAPEDRDNNLDLDNDILTGVNPPLVELVGCEMPCHNWNRLTDTDTQGYGESNTINSWWVGVSPTFPEVSSVVCQQDTLSVTKAVTKVASPTSGTAGHFDVTWKIIFKNNGTTVFDSIQLIDSIVANFGAAYIDWIDGPNITSFAGNPTLPNEGINPNLFDGVSGELAPGDAIQVDFTVELNPSFSGALSTLQNQAIGQVTNNFNKITSDLSDDIEDLTSDNDPTVASFPRIGVAKRVTTIPAPTAVSGEGLNFDVSYEFVIKNIGDTPIENISLIDQMATQFGGAFRGVVSQPVIETATTTATTIGGINPLFDGNTNVELLDSTGTLLPDEQLVISVVVELSPYDSNAIYHPSGFLANQAIASGLYDCAWVSDLSDEGTDPNDTEAPAGINSGTIGDTGGSDDPTLFPFEICGNGIDDDFDGRIDFEDDECEPDCSFIVAIVGDCGGFIVQMPQPDWAFQWFRDSVVITGATSNFFNENPLNDGTYFVEISNNEGCTVPSNSIVIEDCCDPTTPEIISVFQN